MLRDILWCFEACFLFVSFLCFVQLFAEISSADLSVITSVLSSLSQSSADEDTSWQVAVKYNFKTRYCTSSGNPYNVKNWQK